MFQRRTSLGLLGCVSEGFYVLGWSSVLSRGLPALLVRHSLSRPREAVLGDQLQRDSVTQASPDASLLENGSELFREQNCSDHSHKVQLTVMSDTSLHSDMEKSAMQMKQSHSHTAACRGTADSSFVSPTGVKRAHPGRGTSCAREGGPRTRARTARTCRRR